ncbi:MAG: sensor domain-containing diguanylate cyclase [Cellvibrionaceae bacterium]
MEQELTSEQVDSLICIINRVKDHLSIVGRDYRYQIVNDAYLRASGRQRDDIVGRKVADIIGEQSFLQLAKPNLDRCLLGFSVSYHAEFNFAGYDEPKFMEVSYEPMRDESGDVVSVMVSAHDMTELERTQRRLSELANIDPLTGLPNRRCIREILSKALARAMRDSTECHIFFCDLNKFKAVNDDGGHEHGDAVLREVGARLRSTLRAHEDVGRWGGDEFLVVIGGHLSEKQRSGVVSRLRNTLLQPIHFRESSYQLGISVGQAHYPEDGSDLSTLLRLGDHHMYEDKMRQSD